MAEYIRLRRSPRKGGFVKFFFLALAVALAAAAFFLFEFEDPALILEKERTYLSNRLDLSLRASDQKSGIRSLVVTLQQGEKTAQILHKTFPRQAWFKSAGPPLINEKVVIDAKKAGMQDGPVELTIAVRDFSLTGLFQGNETKQTISLIMDTKAPKLTVLHSQQIIQPGTSGMAIYASPDQPQRHGVMIDDLFFPGFATGKNETYVSYFALPWDAKQPKKISLVAYDEAGNEGSIPLATSFKEVPDKRDTIKISDGFLQKKVPEFEQYYPDLQGTLLEKYLYVNNQIRRGNAQTIAQLSETTNPQQLWTDRFLRMPGAGRAGFADQRTYTYKDKAIDTQTHLGVDIASTKQAEVRAANRGTVVFVDYLGIYGNMVLIDHGQGIASLYSHMSSFSTTVGTLVEKDQAIGRTGVTGMAGGDHLHFSMLIHGIFVTPVQWWDQRWIDTNIKSALNAL